MRRRFAASSGYPQDMTKTGLLIANNLRDRSVDPLRWRQGKQGRKALVRRANKIHCAKYIAALIKFRVAGCQLAVHRIMS
jgi:hypothetical protein